jgi:hypothetical protein
VELYYKAHASDEDSFSLRRDGTKGQLYWKVEGNS